MFTPRINVTVKGAANFDKQHLFALATTLTEVARQTRLNSISAIEGTFNIRNSWDNTGPFSVKMKAATKQNLTATVGTAAPWLTKFLRGEPGGIVVNLPQGKFLAVPTINVQRSGRGLIKKGQRPRDFMGKGDVILPMKSRKGYVLFQYVKGAGRKGFFGSIRPGRGGRLIAMYILTPAAKIRQRDLFQGPARKVIQRRFADIFEDKLKKALKTARPD